MFSVKTANDTWFFIGYICVFIVVSIIYYEIRKPIINYTFAILLIIGTLISVLVYKEWNRDGYYIDIDEIVCVKHCYYNGNEYEETDYTDFLDNIASRYNSAECIKKWDKQGENLMPSEYIKIFYKDDSCVVIESGGHVNCRGEKFDINLDVRDLLK